MDSNLIEHLIIHVLKFEIVSNSYLMNDDVMLYEMMLNIILPICNNFKSNLSKKIILLPIPQILSCSILSILLSII